MGSGNRVFVRALVDASRRIPLMSYSSPARLGHTLFHLCQDGSVGRPHEVGCNGKWIPAAQRILAITRSH